MKQKLSVIDNLVISKIYHIRGQKVMIDSDLSEMYGIEIKRLNEQLKRNPERFLQDFMFQLSKEEFENLKSQFATSSWGGKRTMPNVFTEHGVFMLSSVLNSPTAIQVNIKIMRVYTKLREILLTHKDILLKLEQIENKISKHDKRTSRYEEEIQLIVSALKQLLQSPEKSRVRIGYKSAS